MGFFMKKISGYCDVKAVSSETEEASQGDKIKFIWHHMPTCAQLLR